MLLLFLHYMAFIYPFLVRINLDCRTLCNGELMPAKYVIKFIFSSIKQPLQFHQFIWLNGPYIFFRHIVFQSITQHVFFVDLLVSIFVNTISCLFCAPFSCSCHGTNCKCLILRCFLYSIRISNQIIWYMTIVSACCIAIILMFLF